jgi:hypothetical protein
MHKAKPIQTLRNASGEVVPMTAGECLWCKRWVEVGREEAGSTNPFDAAWQDNGDYGCDASPESSEEGCGGHIRPYDVALFLLKGSLMPMA